MRVLCASSVRVGVCGVCVCSGDLELKKSWHWQSEKIRFYMLGLRYRCRFLAFLQDIVSLQSFIVGVYHPFMPPPHVQSLQPTLLQY